MIGGEDLVSVIVPIYKVEAYLKACVDSIQQQSYHNLEIILVDDGSPDLCPQLCDDYAKGDERIHVIHKINGGLSDARNVGLKIAKGDYILFVDSDDSIKLTMVEELMNIVYTYHVQIVATTKEHEKNRYDTVVGTGAQVLHEIFRRYCWEAWGKLFRREIIDNIQYPVGKLYEDLGFVPYVFFQADKVALVDNGLYCYTVREGSIMQESGAVMSLDFIYMLEKLIESKPKRTLEYKIASSFAASHLYEKCIVTAQSSSSEKQRAFMSAAIRFVRQHLLAIIVAEDLAWHRKVGLIKLALRGK